MNLKEQFEHNMREAVAQWNRPYRLTGAQFQKTDDGWMMEHNGLMATGETPAICAENFDHLWTYGK